MCVCVCVCVCVVYELQIFLLFCPDMSTLTVCLFVCVFVCLFVYSLMPLCKKHHALVETGPVFLDSVRHLIGLLLDYRHVRSDRASQGKRMGCMLNLMVGNVVIKGLN